MATGTSVAWQEEKEAAIGLGGAKSKVEALGCGDWWGGDPERDFVEWWRRGGMMGQTP